MSKPTLLVVGDSFQTEDNRYPGQHWSEMFDQTVCVVNLATAGASNTSIADQVLHGIEKYSPDYIFAGFTQAGRVEYKESPAIKKQKSSHRWHTNCEIDVKTKEQWKLDVDMYDLLDFNAWFLRESLLVAKTLDIVRKNSKAYAWTRCGFTPDINQINAAEQQKRWSYIIDSDHFNCETELNPSNYYAEHYAFDKETLMSLPMFHIDHCSFHENFANEVQAKLLF